MCCSVGPVSPRCLRPASHLSTTKLTSSHRTTNLFQPTPSTIPAAANKIAFIAPYQTVWLAFRGGARRCPNPCPGCVCALSCAVLCCPGCCPECCPVLSCVLPCVALSVHGPLSPEIFRLSRNCDRKSRNYCGLEFRNRIAISCRTEP